MHGAKRTVRADGLHPRSGAANAPWDPCTGQVVEAARMVYVSFTRARLAGILSYAQARIIDVAPQPESASQLTSISARHSDSARLR
jgi:hypothetical protein